MANFFSNLLSAGAGSLVDAIGSAIDKNTTSEEERKALDNEIAKARLQHEVEVAALGVRETEAYLADTQSARHEQSRVQESVNAGWLAKNVQPGLAIGIVGLTFWMYWFIIFSGHDVLSKDREMKDIIIYILGALTTVSTQVASYFFGSSHGSSEKSKTILDLAQK